MSPEILNPKFSVETLWLRKLLNPESLSVKVIWRTNLGTFPPTIFRVCHPFSGELAKILWQSILFIWRDELFPLGICFWNSPVLIINLRDPFGRNIHKRLRAVVSSSSSVQLKFASWSTLAPFFQRNFVSSIEARSNLCNHLIQFCEKLVDYLTLKRSKMNAGKLCRQLLWVDQDLTAWNI